MFVGPAFVAVSPGTKKTYEEIENWPTRYKSQLPLQIDNTISPLFTCTTDPQQQC